MSKRKIAPSPAAPGWRVELVPLDAVLPAARNPKRHHADVGRSIERFGFASPLLRDERTGRLVAGHGRLEALRALRDAGQAPPRGVELAPGGAWLVPVSAGWSSTSDAEAEAYLVADNALTGAGGWDPAGLGELLRDLGASLDLSTLPLGLDQAALDAALAGLAVPELGGAEILPAEPAEPARPAEEGEEDDDPNANLPGIDGPAPPFPWFGGKRRVAGVVWQALGDVDQYVEPFAGSLAVLLGRPQTHQGTCATVNDLDAYVANFWRALAAAPDEVAQHADWPVNETDLFARHAWLVNAGRERIAKLESDPEHYDAKVAGWWVWGLCSWIGGGWCSGTGPHRPHLGSEGQGVNRRRPHLGSEGQGVNRRLPHLGGGQGDRGAFLAAYMRDLAARLRSVRVCCGDWQRVVTRGALTYGNSVGVFLDPPYLNEVRAKGCYNTDANADDLANQVREWALVATAEDPRLRVVLAGYEPEHEAKIPATWRRVKWRAGRAYGRTDSADTGNRDLERLWLSPACLPVGGAL